MGFEEQNEASLHEKLRELRSLTNSTAGNTTSIIVDASKYIEELKERVNKLNQDVENSQSSTHQQNSSSPTVTVNPQEKGFKINVFSEKSCPGLLVSILEIFEDQGLEVVDARVSCSDNFCLEAVSEQNKGQVESIDAQVVRQAVLQAIRNWHECSEQDLRTNPTST